MKLYRLRLVFLGLLFMALGCLFRGCEECPASNVQFGWEDIYGNQASNTFTLTAINQPLQYGNALAGSPPQTFVFTNWPMTVSNLAAGNYVLGVQGWSKLLVLAVPPDTNTYWFTSLINSNVAYYAKLGTVFMYWPTNLDAWAQLSPGSFIGQIGGITNAAATNVAGVVQAGGTLYLGFDQYGQAASASLAATNALWIDGLGFFLSDAAWYAGTNALMNALITYDQGTFATLAQWTNAVTNGESPAMLGGFTMTQGSPFSSLTGNGVTLQFGNGEVTGNSGVTLQIGGGVQSPSFQSGASPGANFIGNGAGLTNVPTATSAQFAAVATNADYATNSGYAGSAGTSGVATNALSANSVGLPYNRYLIRNRLYQNLMANKCSVILFVGDSFAVAPFGNAFGVAQAQDPWPNRIATDLYQAARNWTPNTFSPTFVSSGSAGYGGAFPLVFPAITGQAAWGDGAGNTPNISATLPIVGTWWSMYNGESVSYGVFTNVNHLYFAWFTTPYGANDLLLQTNGVTMTTVGGFSATTNTACTNLLVPTGNYTLTFKTTDNITNVALAATAWNNTNGVVCIQTSCGGEPPSAYLQSAAFTNIWKGINPDVVLYLNVHVPSDTPSSCSNTLTQVYNLVNGSFSQNSIWAWIGCPFTGASGGMDNGSYLNSIYYGIATQNPLGSMVYLDVSAQQNDFTNLLSNDGIHPSFIGQAWGAALIEQQMGIIGSSEPSEAILSAWAAQTYNFGFTNYVPSTWVPVPGQVIFRASNDWMYAITADLTNAIYKIDH